MQEAALASFFNLHHRFISTLRKTDPVRAQNILLSIPSKDIAVACSGLSDEERQEIFRLVGEKKRRDLEEEIGFLRRIRISAEQYSRIIEPILTRFDTGKASGASRKYFRPIRPGGRKD